VRADTGTLVGNPMSMVDVKNFRGATDKEARQGHEQSLHSAPVTPEIVAALHAELVLLLLPPPAPPASRTPLALTAQPDPAPFLNGC